MKLFEKIKIKLKDGKSRQFCICGIPIFQYDKLYGNKIQYYFPLYRRISKNNKIACYFKVNRLREYTFLCIQNWINVFEYKKNIDLYIICDNDLLKKEICQNIVFTNSNIKFIKSNIKNTKKLGNKIAIKRWRRAAYAHLTAYWHAYNYKYDAFWNIDADDTIILLPPQRTSNLLNKIEQFSQEKGIDNFSLDMWRSYTGSKHWTFGITYTLNNKNWLSTISNLYNNDWVLKYKDYNIEYNLDWFFTYLLEYQNVKNETFYIENCSFIHYGAFLADIIKGSICKWQNKKIYYPIIINIFKDQELGIRPIAQDCIKFDINVQDSESLEFLQEYVGKISGIKLNRQNFEDCMKR